jgi:hypothetical protein
VPPYGNQRSTDKAYITSLITHLFTHLLTYLLTCLLTPWSRVLLEKLISSQLVKKLPAFYGTLTFLPHLQDPATCPYPKPDQSSPYPPSHFLKIHLNIIYAWVFQAVISLSFPRQNLANTSPLPHTCCMPRLILLNLINRMLFRAQYGSLISSLCSFLRCPVTSPQHPVLKHPQSTFLRLNTKHYYMKSLPMKGSSNPDGLFDNLRY